MDINSLKPFERIELQQLQSHNPKKWPVPRIGDLLQWSKTLKQFRSVFLNMTHHEWLRVRDTVTDGAQVPTKSGAMIVEKVMVPGELGYHGCSAASAEKILSGIKRQPQAGYVPDWKAFYLGSGPGHSLGYIEPPTSPGDSSEGVLLVVRSRIQLTRVFISNAAVNPAVTSQAKADKIKQLLGLSQSAILMDELGKQLKFIEMSDSEDNAERIIPWVVAERHCVAERSGIPVEYDREGMTFRLAL